MAPHPSIILASYIIVSSGSLSSSSRPSGAMQHTCVCGKSQTRWWQTHVQTPVLPLTVLLYPWASFIGWSSSPGNRLRCACGLWGVLMGVTPGRGEGRWLRCSVNRGLWWPCGSFGAGAALPHCSEKRWCCSHVNLLLDIGCSWVGDEPWARWLCSLRAIPRKGPPMSGNALGSWGNECLGPEGGIQVADHSIHYYLLSSLLHGCKRGVKSSKIMYSQCFAHSNWIVVFIITRGTTIPVESD